MCDDEEIYDDTSAEMTEATGLNAIKARFEQAQNLFESPASTSPGPKPGITTKPKVQPKYGGGPGLNICAGPAEKPVVNSFKPTSAIANNINKSDTAKSDKPQSIGNATRRNSKLNIPTAFLGDNTPASPVVENKPIPEPKPKPVPKWKSDSNNNAANANVNGIAHIEKIDIQSLEKTLSRRPSQPESAKAGIAKTSPRGKPTVGSVPDDEGSGGSAPKPMSPRGRGAGGGINVLAMVSSMSGDSNSPVNLKSKLRHVDPAKKGVSPISMNTDHSNSSNEQIPWRRSLKSAKFREQASLKRKSLITVTRKADGKVFHRVGENSMKSEEGPPDKPEKLDCEVDLEALEQDYKDALIYVESSHKVEHGWTETEETYDDCGNLASTRAVSIIEPMTEDEEREWEAAGFPGLNEGGEDLPPPPPDMIQEEYDDVAANPAAQEEEPVADEMYEELPDEPPPPPGPKPADKVPETPPEVPRSLPKVHPTEQTNGEIINPPESTPQEKSKDPKELEKERKRKEKEEKKLLEQKEKELKKLLKTFKTTAEILASSVGKGKVKATAKGKKKEDLSVTEGDEVDILRMTDNPSGKWLVRHVQTQKVGYCDEKNIEVDTSSILNFMTGQKSAQVEAAEPQETYEDVDEAENLTQDEIYEECN